MCPGGGRKVPGEETQIPAFTINGRQEIQKMNFQEALEAEKESLRTEIAASSTMAEAAELIGKAIDRMLYRVSEDAEEAVMPVASYLAETAKAAAYFADVSGEVNVWERAEKRDTAAGKKKKKRRGAAAGR